jgi:hypothetical protein
VTAKATITGTGNVGAKLSCKAAFLELATNGTLSGTPTHKGTYTFTLKATNGIGTPGKTKKHVTVQ